MVAFRAEVTALIQLYIVGVFMSFTPQPDRHGAALDPAPAHRDQPGRAPPDDAPRVINTIGFICTGTVLLIVLVTKFMAGAWIAIVAMSAACSS